MQDEDKSKEQIIIELHELRERVAEFEKDQPERKRAEEALRDSEKRYRSLVETSSDWLWEVDANGRYVYASPRVREILGYAPEEVVGRTPFDLMPEAEARRVGAIFAEIAADRRPFALLENVNLHRDGMQVVLETSGVPVFDSGGEFTGYRGMDRDITERKQAEDALRESEERFRRFANEVSSEGIIVHDHGLILDVNAKFAAMYGYEHQELIGADHFMTIAPSHRELMRSRIGNEDQETYETVAIRKDGASFPIEIHVTNIPFQGKMVRAASVRDLTEHKRAEEALISANQRLADIIEFLPDATFVIDNQKKIIAWNRAMEEMTGVGKNEMLGQGDYSYTIPFYGERRRPLLDFLDEESEELASRYENLRKVGNVLYSETYVPSIYGGKGAYVFAAGAPLFDTHGNRTGAIESIRDITKRKQAEDALRESEERFSRFFRSSPVGTSISRLSDGQFVDANDAFLDLFGYTREEVIGQNPFLLKTWGNPEDRVKMVETLQKQGRIRDFETQCRRKSGEIMDVLISADVIEAAGHQYLLGLTHDITERNRAKEEKDKLEAQLFQAQKMESVGRLAGGVAHDFNNMLGVIIGRAEMALGLGVSGDVQLDLKEILKASQRSADLTRQLLAFARKQTASPKMLDLNDTISGMLKMLRRLIGEDIDLHWIPGLDLWKVKIDPSQVDQILANLTVNARDAISGVGAITMRTENVVIDDSSRAENPEFIPGEYVLLIVKDTGTGMSQEVCEKIFEPFFTTKELGKGTGLGLSTIYGIIKQNDGFIYVASEPGNGTTFKIYLPRFKAETAQVPSEEINDKRPTGSETILLVEDDEAILDLSKMILEKIGYTVLAAHTPLHAIHLVEEQARDIHLLITDVVMPEMHGRELAEQLRAIRPNLKYLYMSGYTADIITQRGILDEGVNFIQKPFGSDELAVKVRQVLDHLE